MTDTQPAGAPWEPSEAFPELARLAGAMRPDWNRTELWDAILAARSASRSWKDIFREVARLAWAEDETPATLRNSARKPAGAAPAPLDPDLKAALLSDLARRGPTGPQPALTEDNDPRAHRAPATEPTDWRTP